MTDNFDYFADNLPQFEISEVRISFFTKSNYIEKKIKSQIYFCNTILILPEDGI